MPRASRRRSSIRRGFTLVELMVVVLLVGILAAIGIMLFRNWVFHTRSVEAVGMLQSIRVAQEKWRSENGSYIDVSSTMDAFYPMTTPGKALYSWDQSGGNDYAKWKLLNPTVSGPVQFGYVTKAGAPFTQMVSPSNLSKPLAVPDKDATTEPWFVIQAVGDTNADGVKSYFVTTSLMGEVYREGEGE